MASESNEDENKKFSTIIISVYGVRHMCICVCVLGRPILHGLSLNVWFHPKSFTISNWISRKWKSSSPFFPSKWFFFLLLYQIVKQESQSHIRHKRFYEHGTKKALGKMRKEEETNTTYTQSINMIHRNFIYNDLWIMCLLPVFNGFSSSKCSFC